MSKRRKNAGIAVTAAMVWMLASVIGLCNAQTVEMDQGVLTEVSEALSNAVTLSSPASTAANMTGINIGIDLTHNSGRQGMAATDYTVIQGDLAARGATLTFQSAGPLTLSILQQYHIFWVEEDFSNRFSAAERTALQQYVADGGNLLLNGDENDPAVLALFDMPYVGGYAYGSTSDITPHAITQGVALVNIPSAGNGLGPIAPAVDLIRATNGLKVVAVNEAGAGAVVVISDEMIIDVYIGRDDNRLLGNNVFDFFALQGSDPLELIEAKLDLVEVKLDGYVDPTEALTDLAAAVANLTAQLETAAARGVAERQALEAKLDVAAGKLADADQQRAALEAKLDALEAKLTDGLARATAEREQIQTDLGNGLISASAERGEIQNELNTLLSSAAEEREEIKQDLGDGLISASAERGEIQNELNTLLSSAAEEREEIKQDLGDGLISASAERGEIKAKLDDGEIGLAQAAEERVALEAKLDAAEAALGDGAEERAALETKLDEMTQRSLAPGQHKDK